MPAPMITRTNKETQMRVLFFFRFVVFAMRRVLTISPGLMFTSLVDKYINV